MAKWAVERFTAPVRLRDQVRGGRVRSPQHIDTAGTHTEGRLDMRDLLSRLAADERGGEVLEYVLIAGLIVVTAIAAVRGVGTKVGAR